MKTAGAGTAVAGGVPAHAETVLNRGNGAEPESLDPAQAGSAMETNILGDMMVGLTTLDAAAKPIPGIAERWETSPDGLTWTFHLRKARWSDGTPVTAENFVSAWRRLLDPKTGARAAQTALGGEECARHHRRHACPSRRLGVTAPGPATVESHAGTSRALSARTADPARRPALAARADLQARRLCFQRALSAEKLAAQRPRHPGEESALL